MHNQMGVAGAGWGRARAYPRPEAARPGWGGLGRDAGSLVSLIVSGIQRGRLADRQGLARIRIRNRWQANCSTAFRVTLSSIALVASRPSSRLPGYRPIPEAGAWKPRGRSARLTSLMPGSWSAERDQRITEGIAACRKRLACSPPSPVTYCNPIFTFSFLSFPLPCSPAEGRTITTPTGNVLWKYLLE